MMRKLLGSLCILLGTALILAALGLLCLNLKEDAAAGDAARTVLEDLVVYTLPDTSQPEAHETEPAVVGDPTMTEVEIDGHAYIGYLLIPSLELELPVMSGWSEQKLHVAPCRYSGSVKSDDMVVMAHNYRYHFGWINNLKPGDLVTFVDMDQVSWFYEVVAQEVLPPDASEDMTAGEFDLTLFTCTFDGQNRRTIRCDRIQ